VIWAIGGYSKVSVAGLGQGFVELLGHPRLFLFTLKRGDAPARGDPTTEVGYSHTLAG